MYIPNTVHATLVTIIYATSSVRLALHYRSLKAELAHQRADLVISSLMFVIMAVLVGMSWVTTSEDSASDMSPGHLPNSDMLNREANPYGCRWYFTTPIRGR